MGPIFYFNWYVFSVVEL